jgi:NAD(P)-dependent dehydrogenase (short-subunit alcohol dehydrogenase family)
VKVVSARGPPGLAGAPSAVVCAPLPIALVSGANRGIGRETARQLADRDYEVIVSARDEDKAREAAEAVGGRPLQLDVSDPASIERAAASVAEDPGTLDVLVNNAGSARISESPGPIPISTRSSGRWTPTSSAPTG